jgi:isocitrate lyase
VTGERTAEGFFRVRGGIESCIARGLAYAPYADLLWMETGSPDLAVAREFAEAIKAVYPDQMLAYNCSPSFNWRAHLDEGTIAKFQRELGEMGYKFQFITLAGFHALNQAMFELARGYAAEGMPAYVEAAGRRVRRRGRRLHRHQAPARGRHRLLRPGHLGHHARCLDRGTARLDRASRAVLTLPGALTPRKPGLPARRTEFPGW